MRLYARHPKLADPGSGYFQYAFATASGLDMLKFFEAVHPKLSQLHPSSFHALPTENTRPRRLMAQNEDNITCQSAIDLASAPVNCSFLPYSADYLRLILDSKVYDIVETTSLTRADGLSDRLQCNVLLKREDLQPISSYKLRGIYNKMAHLNEDRKWRGVITYSAGNHALAVAYAAKKLRMPSIIVLPIGTSDARFRHFSRLGSTLILHGTNLDSAKEECVRLQQLHGLTYISACEDPYVIAGHGTIGPEILKQANVHRLKAIFCSVDCGTLIAGLGIYVKRVAPHVKIIGVESDDGNEFCRLVQCKRDVQCKRGVLCKRGVQCKRDVQYKRDRTFEEHAASRNISEELVRICAEVIDDIVQVDMDRVFMASRDIYEDTQHILESTGAMSIAGLKCWVASNRLSGSEADIIAIISEANVDFFEIPDIIKQADIAEKGSRLETGA